MVILALALAKLPAASVAVSTTVWVPTSLQSKLVLLRERVKEQLSEEPLSTMAGVMVIPAGSLNCKVRSCASTVGTDTSDTVTLTEVTVVLPLVSVTVKSIGLLPRWEQSKLVWLNVFDAIPQLSVLLISISETEIVAVPEALRVNGKLVRAFTVGFSVSGTVPIVTDSLATQPSCEVTVTE